MNRQELNDALLEIGTEEIPSSYIEPALKQIGELAQKKFAAAGLKYTDIKTYATPRRLVLYVSDLAAKSEDKTEELLGPALLAAKDAAGNWTQAATGFAAKNGVKPDNLEIKKTDKGDRLCFVKKLKGEKTEKLLLNIFPEIIKNIYFPKTMIWESSGFKFARPVRNIIALYGKKTVKFKIADVASGNWTIGLHAVDKSKIKIDLPKNYLVKLKNKHVLADQNERKETLKKSLEESVKSAGSVIYDDNLTDEVNYLVEFPTAVLCEFDKRYLELPPEALTVCIKKSQKCFAVNDKNGKFSNYFIDVKNGVSKYQEVAREGYEKVVGARLSDAEFFYKNDLKKGLDANAEKLKGVVFHKEIGTVYEKNERVRILSVFINKEFCAQVDGKLLDRAVVLSKADLVSEMVFEYGELQGVMGKIYAKKTGENNDVADAVEQHYWPLSASGELPKNNIALIISIADKLDTLAANFAVGLEPSGSADPYGLRRAAIGLIRMIFDKFPNVNLNDVVNKSFELLPEKVKNNQKFAQAKERFVNFLWQRIESIFEGLGYLSGDIKAVSSAAKNSGLQYLGNLQLKLDALKTAKQKGDFVSIAEVFKRINNILAQAKKQNIEISNSVNRELLRDDAENALYASSQKINSQTQEYISAKNYDKVFDKVLEIKPDIDNFFAKVMVMAEDETIKKNRFALLNSVKSVFDGFIDFSLIVN
ncbi:glycine--tRNA ligase subunit beta [Endomicrobium proavitum]|uniref:Glycine--tRNA ligase beta subunit n=1 Tax=Endomicrobium proavitum TaxID=1408281 RepID=A0A0G3WH77_9BACT|nr:glycine--tRNA ligase subunit beta [Endomicrobium proavitum]AKL97976.1 Glycine--tRNA ligase beta subunit [Endomicrobium proavitum]